MKKTTLCLILAVIVMAAFIIPAFAGYTDSYATVEEQYLNKPVNDKSFSHGSTANVVRNHWTPSRNPDETIIFNPNTVYVLDAGLDNCSTMKMVGPQWFTGDNDFDACQQFHSLSLKPESVTGFCGFIAAYCNADKIAVPGDQQTGNDSLFTPVSTVNPDASADYVLNTGLGYTFLKDSTSKVRFFVRCLTASAGSATYKNDVIYYDYDTGMDLTKEYHYYDLYKNEEGTEYRLYIDDKLAASVVLDNKNNVTESVETGDLTGIYFQKAELKDEKGNTVKTTEHALVNEKAKVVIALSDKDTVCYWSAGMLLDWVDYPDVEEETAPVTEAPGTDAPGTDAPAANTDAPAAKTDAPAANTDAPAATEAPKAEKKGCGSAVASMAIIAVVSLGALAISKKH